MVGAVVLVAVMLSMIPRSRIELFHCEVAAFMLLCVVVVVDCLVVESLVERLQRRRRSGRWSTVVMFM